MDAAAQSHFTGKEAGHAVEKRPWIFTRPTAKTGIVSWLTTVDHKRVGIMYGISALLFFLVGGIEALIIRIQLAVPNNTFISHQFYNEMFTMHATTMIFLAVMPLSAAFFNYIMPLQIGARDVAFPRLNGFAFWVFLAGAIVLNVGWFVKSGLPDAGWFGYAPLTSTDFSNQFKADMSTDLWVMGLQILGVSSVVGSMNFIITIINMRAPGMTMMRLPVFTWMTLITAFLIILSFPAITIALVELMMDRSFGTNFFEVSNGGLPILWQHLFWVFGHPEVYILILPAMGIVSEILPTFSRKPLFGYPIIVFSGATIGFLGFGVWSHHMFTTGMGTMATAAFSLATMAIAVPTGVKMFNWIGTMWGGHLQMRTPMMFALGFVWMFLMGGLSGIMHSAAPADAQQQDSYFVVAHFHYVLIGGAVFGLLSGIHYWFPLIFGRRIGEFWGKLSFWVIFAGFNITFFPMHFLGLNGMPRRTAVYDGNMGWNDANFIATVGAFILACGIGIYFAVMLYTYFKGEKAGRDPWDGRTLEWSIPNPPPEYNFAVTPTVHARDAFWYEKHHKEEIAKEKSAHAKEDEAHGGVHMPSQSWFPLMTAIGLLIGGLFFVNHKFVGAICGGTVMFLGIYFWALEGPGGYHVHPSEDDDKSGSYGKH
ncbi:cytochrome c oxidase subunit I [Nibricoccus aquaticus]|uniref:Cytochrome c oxidase subunit 1 n=1 Tax=Nibricoccus aquaticus TaxID=2576891 RepID=A0A290QF82_9BACT|nr:cytochrome c oxidase subunit I [Nibricoccus aquaticus]ATC64936.1 cytochrome c oxidase subunit I [Nibricoccus aquaticus]